MNKMVILGSVVIFYGFSFVAIGSEDDQFGRKQDRKPPPLISLNELRAILAAACKGKPNPLEGPEIPGSASIVPVDSKAVVTTSEAVTKKGEPPLISLNELRAILAAACKGKPNPLEGFSISVSHTPVTGTHVRSIVANINASVMSPGVRSQRIARASRVGTTESVFSHIPQQLFARTIGRENTQNQQLVPTNAQSVVHQIAGIQGQTEVGNSESPDNPS
jgi:hypothetical protein